MKIAGYTYRAGTYCAGCIVSMLPTGPDEAFDGWADLTNMRAEDNLLELAFAFGIDREDEYTFDSDYFPKVIFSSQIEDIEECGKCGSIL